MSKYKYLFYLSIQIFIIILVTINYINADYYSKWIKLIMLPCFMIICFTYLILYYYDYYDVFIKIISFLMITILVSYTAFLFLDTKLYYDLPIKLDYANNQVIDLNTNKKLKPILKSADYSSSKSLDKLIKKYHSTSQFHRYKLLIDNDKNYYIFKNDDFKKEFNLKSVYFNKKTHSIKYIYTNKENKELYEIKGDILLGEFYEEYEKYDTKFKKLKINEDEELFENE